MKIIKSFLILFVFLFYQSFVIADNPVAQKFQLNQMTNFEICQNNSNTCITDDTVLRDLYPKQNIQIINNIGMIENKILVSIIASAKFNDGKDTYAIFFSQSNQIDGNQGIATCHACGANLGIAIYQYHNKWKLFGIDNSIEEMGSFGYINVDKSLINIYSAKSERFFITLNSSSMNQGYGGEYSNIFEVNSDFLYSVQSANLVKIKSRGYITIGESNCGAKEDSEEWISKIQFLDIKSTLPSIKLFKSFNKCGSNKIIRTEEERYIFDNTKKSYIKK